MKWVINTYLLIAILDVSVGQLTYIRDQETFEKMGFSGPQPRFIKSLYKARIDDNNIVVQMRDDHIILQNCQSLGTKFEYTLDQSKYFYLSNPMLNYETGNCTIQMTNIYKRKDAQLDGSSVDIIILRAFTNQYVVAETYIAVFNTSNNQNVMSLIFDYNGREFIGLDYFYFRLFVTVLAMTGLVILLLELYDLIMARRSSDPKAGGYTNV